MTLLKFKFKIKTPLATRGVFLLQKLRYRDFMIGEFMVKMFKFQKTDKFNHFANAEKFSDYKVINKIVNNFVKKVVKSG